MREPRRKGRRAGIFVVMDQCILKEQPGAVRVNHHAIIAQYSVIAQH